MSVVDVDFSSTPARQPAVIAPTAARVGIVVDAACDLPDGFFDSQDVAVIPVSVKVGNTVYVDQHNPESTLRYLREQHGGRGFIAESSPLPIGQMQSLFLERFALDYDSVYCLTITSTRSQIHDNAMQASAQSLTSIRVARDAAGIQRPFQFRVIDSKNLFAAQGVQALALRDLIDKGTPAKDIRDALFKVIDATYGYIVIDDLKYMRNRARLRGDRSIGLIGATLGTAMDVKPIIRGRLGTTTPVAKFRGRADTWQKLFTFTAKQVQRGLMTPHVVLSYGGTLNDVRDARGFSQLEATCQNEGVALHLCHMSISGMVNMGTEALCVGFAGQDHSPEF